MRPDCTYFLNGKKLSYDEFRAALVNDTDLAVKYIGPPKTPDMPFRNSSAWGLAMFKRALRDAVNSGQSWVGWTSGETQNDRYDLAKSVDSIEVEARDDTFHDVRIFEKSGSVIDLEVDGGTVKYGQFANKRLDEIIGKDMAEKILTVENDTAAVFEGDGLKVGGEGMKGFYDKILPSEVQKYVKQWGAKVEKGNLAGKEVHVGANEFKEWYKEQHPEATDSELSQAWYESSENDIAAARKWKAKSTPIWRVTITPEMADSIKGESQMLFASAAVPEGTTRRNFLKTTAGAMAASFFVKADAARTVADLTELIPASLSEAESMMVKMSLRGRRMQDFGKWLAKNPVAGKGTVSIYESTLQKFPEAQALVDRAAQLNPTAFAKPEMDGIDWLIAPGERNAINETVRITLKPRPPVTEDKKDAKQTGERQPSRPRTGGEALFPSGLREEVPGMLFASSAVPATNPAPAKALGMGGIGVERKLNTLLGKGVQAAAKGLNRAGKMRVTKKAASAASAIVEAIPVLGPVAKMVMDAAPSQLIPHWGVAHEAVMAQREADIAKSLAGQEGGEFLRILRDGGTSDLLGLTVPKQYAKDPVMQAAMWKVLGGEANLNTLPPALRPVVEAARETIDILGERAVAAGLLKAETVAKGFGTYLRRFYLEHEQNRYGLSGVIGNAIEKARDRKMLKGKMDLSYTKARLSDAWAVTTRGANPRPIAHGADGAWRFDSAEDRDEWFHGYVERLTAKEMRLPVSVIENRNADSVSPQLRSQIRNVMAKTADQFNLTVPKTEGELTAMGLIRDPGYVVGKIIATMGHDLAMAKMFATLEADPNLVSDSERPGFVRMADNKALGKISGRWVEENLARDLYEIAGAPNDALKIYDAMLGLWKETHTSWNPATHGRNLIGNFMFADFGYCSPVSPANLQFYGHAWNLVVGRKASGGVTFAELFREGVLGSDIGSKEFAAAIAQMTLPEKPPGKFKAMMMSLRAGANKAYEIEDALFKTAAYAKAKQSGMSPKEAAAHVRLWFPYYDNVPKTATVRNLKRTIMPFLSFYYESGRILLNAMQYRPATLAKWMAIPGLVTVYSLAALGYGLPGDDDERKRKAREAIYAEMRGRRKIGPITLQFSALMPGLDDQGRPMMFDMTNINPYANSLGMRVEEGREDPGFAVQLGRSWFSSPVASTALNLMLNRDPFTDKPLVHSEMDAGEKAMAIGNKMRDIWAPAFAASYGVVQKTVEGTTGGGDVQRSTMERRTAGGDVVRAWTGLDFRNASPQVWRIANRWAERNGYSLGADPGGDTTKLGRARQRVYQAILNNDVNAVERELTNLAEVGAADGKTPNAITTPKQLVDLIDDRNPLRGIKGDKGEDSAAKIARFKRDISDPERASVERLESEWKAMRVRAVREIWREIAQRRAKK
jgi:hypothetical protein